MKRLLICLLCAMLMFALPASAEDFFTIDIDMLDMASLNSDDYVGRHLSASTQGIRVTKYISASGELAVPVKLTLMQMDSQTLLLDRDYGFRGGMFDSGVIYLPYVDDRTIPYLVTLYVGDYVYAIPFMHLQPRLTENGACTSGVRLYDLDPSLGSDWLMATMVDLDQLRAQGVQRVDVCASNSYVIGYADIALSGDRLSVSLAFDASANVEVIRHTLYVVTDCASYASGQRAAAYALGESVDVGGASSALIYLPMQVSYDPAGLPGFRYEASSGDVQEQLRLWNENCGGTEWTEFSDSRGGWEEDSWGGGWNGDGWADGWDDGWGDGWEGTADGWADGGW